MDFPKLEFPSKEYQRFKDAEQGEHAAGNFAARYDAAVTHHFSKGTQSPSPKIKELLLGQLYKDADIRAQKTCEHINAFFKEKRNDIVQEMQGYLLQHNGVIDSWPDPGYTMAFRYFDAPGPTFQFDFFGADYVPDGKGNVKRTSSKPVFRNDYHFPDTKDYRYMKEREEILEKQAKAERIKGDTIPRFFAFLGFLYCIYAAIAVVGDIFFDFGSKLLAIMPPTPKVETFLDFFRNLGWLLLALPVYIYQFLEDVCGDISGILVIIAAVILIGACLLGAFCCQKYLAFYRKEKRQHKKAKMELQKFRSSQEYSRVMQENAALKKAYETMAEQWLKEWYDWVCRTRTKQEKTE